eukprot:scaffold29799_cov70-Cyclotella_meneghiniana.AAC.3
MVLVKEVRSEELMADLDVDVDVPPNPNCTRSHPIILTHSPLARFVSLHFSHPSQQNKAT